MALYYAHSKSDPLPGDRVAVVKLEIGGIVFAVEAHGDDRSFVMSDVYEDFRAERRSDVAFAVRRGPGPELEFADKLFDSGGPWALYRHQDKWCFVTPSAPMEYEAYRMVVLDTDLSGGDIHITAPEGDQTSRPYPLAYPLEELIFMNLLSQGRGVLFHACAINDNGHGFLFAGSSGAGKSTMADLWKDQKGVTILSDDRVIVREMDGRFWVYGTPWHGDVKLCSSEKVPIERVFFLRHDKGNSALPLKAPRALTSLFVRSFPTYWNPKGMAFTLAFLSRISQAVPCYDLGFLPDRTIMDFVRTMGSA